MEARLLRWRRLLVVVGAVELAVSTALLLIASTSQERPAVWVGVIDVVLAFALVVTVTLLCSVAARRFHDRAFRVAHSITVAVSPLMFVVMWLFAENLIWNTLLPGLAWRTFLFLYSLPSIVVLLHLSDTDLQPKP